MLPAGTGVESDFSVRDAGLRMRFERQGQQPGQPHFQPVARPRQGHEYLIFLSGSARAWRRDEQWASEHMRDALRSLTEDGRLLFAARFVRLFAYGALSVVLVLYLVGVGLTESATGVLLTATLLGDTFVSLFLTTRADRLGRRRMLIVGATLMAAAGVAFAFTHHFWLLVVAGTIGVISPSGHEVGPFLPIEQAALSQVVPARARTDVFAWYTLAGSIATALGALAAGLLTSTLQHRWAPVDSYRAVVVAYACIGFALCGLFMKASASVEAPRSVRAAAPRSPLARLSGLHESQGVVLRLAALFALDSFGGGFVVQSFAAYWFYLRFGVDPKTL